MKNRKIVFLTLAKGQSLRLKDKKKKQIKKAKITIFQNIVISGDGQRGKKLGTMLNERTLIGKIKFLIQTLI